MNDDIEITAGGETIKTTTKGLEAAAKLLNRGRDAVAAIRDHHAELETIARRRREVLEEKREAMKGYKDQLDSLDEAEARVLSNLDAARAGKPPLLEVMEGDELRECLKCGEAFRVELWMAEDDVCPGCGK